MLLWKALLIQKIIRISVAHFTGKKIVSVVAHARSFSLLAKKVKNEMINTDWNKQDFYI